MQIEDKQQKGKEATGRSIKDRTAHRNPASRGIPVELSSHFRGAGMHIAGGVIGKEINSDCVTRRERSPFYTCLSTYRQDLLTSVHWINSIHAWPILLTSLLSLRAGVCKSDCVLLVSTSGLGPRPHHSLQASIVFQRLADANKFPGVYQSALGFDFPNNPHATPTSLSPSMCCYARQFQSTIRSWLDPQMPAFN